MRPTEIIKRADGRDEMKWECPGTRPDGPGFLLCRGIWTINTNVL